MPLPSQQYLAGIQGFVPGGNATVNLDLNKRFWELLFQIGAGSTTVPTAISSVLQWVNLKVNGTTMLDWTPTMFTEAARWDGYLNNLQTGILYIPFALPRFRGLRDGDKTAFDLSGQTSAVLEMSLLSSPVSPVVLGLQSYDYKRNLVRTGANKGKVRLRPLKRLRQSFPINGTSGAGIGSSTDITQIPITNPIRRLILIPDNAGSLTHYEVWCDGTIVDQGDLQNGSTATWINNGLSRQILYGVGNNGSSYVNTAQVALPLVSYVLDFTYRGHLADALKCNNSLLLRVWSNNSGVQNLQIAEEFIAYGYK